MANFVCLVVKIALKLIVVQSCVGIASLNVLKSCRANLYCMSFSGVALPAISWSWGKDRSQLSFVLAQTLIALAEIESKLFLIDCFSVFKCHTSEL